MSVMVKSRNASFPLSLLDTCGTYSEPIIKTINVKTLVLLSCPKLMMTGIGMTRVIKSVKTSLPIIAYPAGTAAWQWVK